MNNMILVSDIGNSRIKIALFDNDINPIYFESIEHNESLILKCLNNISEKNYNIEHVYYASVNTKVNSLFEKASKCIFNINPYEITLKDFTLKENYATPKEAVGIDMILAGYAVININPDKKETKYASVVVSLGTATTISVMTSEFEFLGGTIMPGLGTSFNAMVEKTSLPAINLENIKTKKNALNTETIEALEAGVYYQTVGGITLALENIVKEIKEKYSLNSIVYITGGHGNNNLLPHKIMPYLVLEGIYLLHKNNSTTT